MDPLGILGAIGVAAQFVQIGVQFGLDWKDAPDAVRSVINELHSLIIVLSETNKRLLCNPDFAAALLSTGSGLGSDSKLPDIGLLYLKQELESVLLELNWREPDRRLGWKRIKETFLARKTRETVEHLHRKCHTLNELITVEAAAVTVSINRKLADAMAEQQTNNRMTMGIARTTDKIQREVESAKTEQHSRNLRKKEREILEWLTPTEFSDQQSDLLSKRQPGTGEWLIKSEEFRNWIETTNNILFCPGNPGAGKTFITGLVIDTLSKRFSNKQDVGIAYIYCNFGREEKQRFGNLLSSILRQICQHRSPLPEEISALYHEHADNKTHPSVEEISTTLRAVLPAIPRIFIVVDALDELQDSDGCRSKLLSMLFKSQKDFGIKIFATSRKYQDIIEHFETVISIKVEIAATKEDIYAYLRGRISDGGSRILQTHQEDIISQLVEKVDGIFLLAYLYFESIRTKKTFKKIKDALNDVSSGPRAYDQAYEKAMERIMSQDEDSRELAMKALSWIVLAKRELSTRELLLALAVEFDDTELDEDNIPYIQDILSVSAALIVVDERSEKIRLVHFTTQEYLTRNQNRWFPEGHLNIAKVCATYLLCTQLEHDDNLFTSFRQTKLTHPLFSYAGANWGHHAREASKLGQNIDDILVCLKNENFGEAACLGILDGLAGLGMVWGSLQVPHLVVILRLDKAIDEYITPETINLKDGTGWTPLAIAAYLGYSEIVVSLIDRGVDTDSKDSTLLGAIQGKHDDIVKFLLEKGAHITTKSSGGLSALALAASRGSKATVKLLLDAGADIESRDMYDRTPLMWAVLGDRSEKEYLDTLNLLLEAGANVNACTMQSAGWTPLMYAARDGYKAIAERLLQSGADIEARETYNGRTPLILSAINNKLDTVKFLAEKGANIQAKDFQYGRTPLLHAIIHSSEDIVEFLLENYPGSELERDDIGYTGLLICAELGSESMMAYLLTTKMDPNARTNYGVSLLSLVVARRASNVVEFVLKSGRIKIDSRDNFGRNVLWWAHRCDNEGITALILEYATRLEISLDESGINQAPSLPRARGEKSSIICDICALYVPKSGEFYHCSVCLRGDFDLCVECYNLGAHCLVKTHSLELKRYYKKNQTP